MSHLVEISNPSTGSEVIANARAVRSRIRVMEERYARLERMKAHAEAVKNIPAPPPKRDWIFVATGEPQMAVKPTFADDETRMSRVRSTRHAKRIIAWVCRRFQLDLWEISSNRRVNRVLKPRQLAIQMIAHSRHCEALSLPDIGRLFGGRDHTTILHSARLATSYQRRYSNEPYKKLGRSAPVVNS